MDKSILVSEWFKFADMDLSVATFLMANHYPKPLEVICYHCQQAAEKYLKGYLVFNDVEPIKTHNLVELLKLCQRFNSDFETLKRACFVLTKYGVMPRYPFEMEISIADTEMAINYAETIEKTIKRNCFQNS